MPSSTSIELTILQVVHAFAEELQRYRARLNRRSYDTDRITLSVSISDNPRVELRFGGDYSSSQVTAASLGVLMEEAYRRAGFEDREAGRLRAASDALLALPAPTTTTTTD